MHGNLLNPSFSVIQGVRDSCKIVLVIINMNGVIFERLFSFEWEIKKWFYKVRNNSIFFMILLEALYIIDAAFYVYTCQLYT